MAGFLAHATMVVHFIALLYIGLGGFLAWRWPKAIFVHIFFALWGVAINTVPGLPCRNCVDPYRYWRRAAVTADLARPRHASHVAIETFQHDHNIGTVVRPANAFAARAVHIVGRRRWNRRGAMVTDRYQHIAHHPDISSLLSFATNENLAVVAVDNTPGACRIETASLPRQCILLFGQEGPGLTPAAHDAAELVVSIAQFGSTRSINAGVAAGIVMHAWIRQHANFD